jgi:hypothetical protein
MRKAHVERLHNTGIDPRRALSFAPRIPEVEAALAKPPASPFYKAEPSRPRAFTVGTDASLHHLGNQQKAHLVLVAYPLVKVQHVYKYVFEKILNEQVSTLPVAQN